METHLRWSRCFSSSRDQQPESRHLLPVAVTRTKDKLKRSSLVARCSCIHPTRSFLDHVVVRGESRGADLSAFGVHDSKRNYDECRASRAGKRGRGREEEKGSEGGEGRTRRGKRGVSIT
ncbi:hypothetical protein HZH66_009626 [Vespula vulgaris]|uniref:Uncharacterized protein n=1 Tax=Vespula vulgaris TaxID=7454 RepID=A0A834JMB5_VESVU|nr:hypothetical protein HZH66_009626 [Vespula vulgaris]